jgi:hypothetical protein
MKDIICFFPYFVFGDDLIKSEIDDIILKNL